MKKLRRLSCVLLSCCLLIALALPALAAETYSETPASAASFTADTQKIIVFPAARDYGYWKIAIQNTSSADLSIEIRRDTPSGAVVYADGEIEKTVKAGTTQSIYCPKNAPLEEGVFYYLIVQSCDSTKPLEGTLWYKHGTADLSELARPSGSSTGTAEVSLSQSTQKIIVFPVSKAYGYWKITIQNPGPAALRFQINKDAAQSEGIYPGGDQFEIVEAGATKSFYCPGDTPLEEGNYYILVQSRDGGVNLDGTLWYKFATEDIKAHE